MALICPRCDVPLRPVRAAPHMGGAPAELDICDTCQGLWIDGAELAAVCPTVSDLPDRRFEVSLLGQKGAGIKRCPRCGQEPYEFVVLEVAIDFCAGCVGVWFDGDEYGEIAFEGVPSVDAPKGGPYRAAAAAAAIDAARSGEVACAQCSAKVPLRETYMWERGLVCRFCHAARTRQGARDLPSGGAIAERFLLLLQEAYRFLAYGRRFP